MENPLPTTTDEATTTCYNIVFIDTNLNTHLALTISDSDTVFDLKKRIVVEHALCFPEIGKITVHALKVKRRGCFYHLSESMYVKSAFHGLKKCWFISVDASSVVDRIDDHENKNCLVPANIVVAQVGYHNDESKRLLKGCSSLLREHENDRKLVLGSDGGDGSGKHVSGEISNVGSRKRKREEEDIEKDEVRGIDNEGGEGNLENDSGNGKDILLEGKDEETGYDLKRKYRSKKKSRNAVEDLPVENTIRECSQKGVELRQDGLMHEGNKNIADEHCIIAVYDANKSNDGPAGGGNEHKNNLSKSNVGDSDAEDLSHLQTASKKKHKREKKRGNDSSVKEGRTLIPDYKEETLVHRDENDRQSILGTDGIDGGGKHVSEEISTMVSHRRKKEDQDIEKVEVRKTEIAGQEGNLENDIGYGHGKVFEERSQETGCDKKKTRKSKKKHRIAVEDPPQENTVQECSKSGAELFNDGQVHKGNEGIANGDCINATFDASKRSDILSQKVDGLAGGSNEYKNTSFKDKAGDLECEMADTSRAQAAAKKKHKREKKRGDENSVKEDRTLDHDYKKEKLGHHTNMEPLTEEKNKYSPHSPTDLEYVHIVSALPSVGKSKGKNNLSKSAKEETSPATDVKGDDTKAIKVINSKDFDEETNAASVPGKHVLGLPDLYAGKGRLSDAVQESNDKSSSQGINKSDIDLGNAESRPNASEREMSYLAESSKDDGAISAGMHPDVLNQEPDDRDENPLTSGGEIVTHDKEEREKSPSICPSTVQVEKSKLLVAEEECMKSKEAKSKIAEHSELGDGKKSSKKRKNAKKNKELANAEQLTSTIEHAEVSLNGIFLTEAPNYRENSGSVVAKEESNMHSKKRIEIPEVDAGSTSVLATDREINDVFQNVVESVNKITETFIETQNVDGKSRKKSKKRRGFQTNNLPELQTQNGDVFYKDHSKEADSTSKMLKGGNDITVQNGTLATQLNSVSFETSELPPQKPKVDYKAKTGDVDDAGNGSHIQASSESNRINFRNYFMPGKINHETVDLRKVLIDKASELEGANGEPKKTKKKKKNVNVHPSPEVKTMDPSFNENQKEKPQPGVISSKGLATSLNEGKPQSAILSSKSLAPSSNENQKVKPQPGGNSSKSLVPSSNENPQEKPQPGVKSGNIEPASSFSSARDKPIRLSEVSGGGVRTVPSNKSDEPKSDPDEARKHDATKLSMGGHTKIDKEAGTASISSLESSKNSKSPYKNAHGRQSDKKHNNALNKKATIGNSGNVVSSSQHGNRLIETMGATFKGDISRASADEDNSDSSDATTRTPSDNSSDYSDGESSTDISSSQSGSPSLKRKGGGRKNSSKLLSSGMSLDAIFRSSNRYKKAKITASQSQLEDTESQPVDFVPESEPIY